MSHASGRWRGSGDHPLALCKFPAAKSVGLSELVSLLLASWRLYVVGVIVYLIFEPLGLDVELPSWPSDLQTHWL